MTAAQTPFARVFIGRNLWVGIGLFGLGLAVFVALLIFLRRGLLLHRRDLDLWLLGPFLLVLGVGAAIRSHAEACAACREPLVETHTRFPEELEDQVHNAVVVAKKAGTVEHLVALERAPLPDVSAPVTASLEFVSCPSCKKVGRVWSARRKLGSGTTLAEDASAPVVLLGVSATRVADTIAARNSVWEKAVYGTAPRL
jgi:hypothetical protein